MHFDLAFDIVFCDVKNHWIRFVFYPWNRDTVSVALNSAMSCCQLHIKLQSCLYLINFKLHI
jgi:hypothetical protein